MIPSWKRLGSTRIMNMPATASCSGSATASNDAFAMAAVRSSRGRRRFGVSLWEEMVGVSGFEPPTPERNVKTRETGRNELGVQCPSKYGFLDPEPLQHAS